MKKILFITSFYSGLRESITQNKWSPQGMPAMYKLLDGIKHSELGFDYFFFDSKAKEATRVTNKNFPGTYFHIAKVKQKTLPGPFKIFQSYFFAKKKHKKVKSIIDFSQYDLIYLDRANVDMIPFLKKEFKGKIFLRLHGVITLYQSYKNSFKFRLYNYYKLLSYRKEIDFILSSMDGTPAQKFMDAYTNQNTQKVKMINGVAIEPEVLRETDKKIRFLFVGRIEKDKGIMQVINVFNKLDREALKKCELVIVGGGSLLEKVQSMTKNNDSISVLSSVEHKRMSKVYKESDVLISLNLLGNLSNVVLEAINYELAIITLKKDLEKEFDEESNDFLLNNVSYVDRNDIESQLLKEVSFFVDDFKNVTDYQEKTRSSLKPKLISWEERIRVEIDMIKNLIAS